MTVLKKQRPTNEGYYWFKPDSDTPLAIFRPEEYVVCVCKCKMGCLAIVAACGVVAVDDASGMFAGPIPKPMHQHELN
jgi:hypothetical protein